MTVDRHEQTRTAGRQAGRWGALALIAALGGGCATGQLQGTSSSYLIIASLQAASGATPSAFSGTLSSDVRTLVKASDGTGAQTLQPTVFADPGQVTFTLALKDPGSSDVPTKPTSTNFITVNRYHVDFVRSDGRNTQGVDVPYSFDGATTVTVTDIGGTASFTIVRAQAKQEAPLLALVGGGGEGSISTIAVVTFYGTDQAGRAVNVAGQISVNFADWGDPQ